MDIYNMRLEDGARRPGLCVDDESKIFRHLKPDTFTISCRLFNSQSQ